MRKIRQVLRQHFEMQQSRRAIARSVGISRDAVTDYLTRAAIAGLSWPLQLEMDDAELEELLFPSTTQLSSTNHRPEPDWPNIHQELKRKGATKQGLHGEYIKENPNGIKYSRFCELYREFKPTLRPSLRQVYTAGERVFVDYAGATMPVYDQETNALRYAQLFVGVLGASNYIYAEAHWSQSLPNWLSAHVRMFEFFGGSPVVIVCDNLKSGVTKASRTEPVINESYQHMADHFDCHVVPARPHEPTDKAKAENSVLIVERWIVFALRKQIFTGLGELNKAIKERIILLNAKPFQKLPGSRKTAFEKIDEPELQPLPVTRYEYTVFQRMQIGLDYRVRVDGRTYSVPSTLCRKVVDLRITATVIEVLYHGRRVASHERQEILPDVVKLEHMPPSHRAFGLWNRDAALTWALSIGVYVHYFLNQLLGEIRVREQGYRAHNVLKKMAHEFGDHRLDAACRRAIDVGAKSLNSVRSILRNQLDRIPAEQEDTQDASFEHPNLRGPEYYH